MQAAALAAVEEYLDRSLRDFPTLRGFVKNRIGQTVDGIIPPLDGLDKDTGDWVRNVCRHFGLELPT